MWSYTSTYAFIVWTGIILPFLLPLPICQLVGSLGRLRNTEEKRRSLFRHVIQTAYLTSISNNTLSTKCGLNLLNQTTYFREEK